jgi:uncharacterized protein (DUF2252 family)
MATATNQQPSITERPAGGKQARQATPRSSHGDWKPTAERPDPLQTLERQAASRVPELVPLRYGRMLESPFSFYRGAAAVMAADLATTPTTGLRVQLCGDAHLSNFGGFASPDRQLVFDLNDFDETLPGPWEWDLKRLAASIEIAGRDLGFDDGERSAPVLATARRYREAMREFVAMRNLEVWYARLDLDSVRERWGKQVSAKRRKTFERNVAKAHSKDSIKAMSRLAERTDGELRIVSDPPLIVPIEELAGDFDPEAFEAAVQELLAAYRATLQGSGRHLLASYRYMHVARKVVGVGSVGTRAWIVLLLGRDDDDPLFLQLKEAEASVLEPYAGPSEFENHGRRVVEGQWLMQAASDVALGWIRAEGIDGAERDFYVRQLWDWKRSAEIDGMTPRDLGIYGEVCAWTLARAHARSGDRAGIGGYLGRSDVFDRAIAEFAARYADQNQRDFERMRSAVSDGQLTVQTEA